MNQQPQNSAGGELSEPVSELDRLAHLVIGAAIDVHRGLGPGLLEGTYEEALCLELSARKVPFARQVPADITYKHLTVGQIRLDLLIAQELVVELKAVDAILPIHTAQLISYLKVTRLRLGLLINFNVPLLRDGIKRCINTPAQRRSAP